MNVSYKGIFVVVLLASVLGLSACKQEGPAEKAGQKIDKAVEQSDKKIDQAADKTGKKIEQAGEYMDDTALTAKVKAEIAKDPLLKVSQITVTTTKGIVRLSGIVDSNQSIDRALEITRNIKGVQATENGLVVKSTN